ncbi:glycosyl hydrolase-related protein [Microtetraspora malaysiensis]|uniref:glycosyl hydrolase-related protein n=1 Tax=Microtetraspora malaysiensis TaxID=161358 RepID=UPI003D8B6321
MPLPLVRFHEAHGGRGPGDADRGLPAQRLTAIDLLERPLAKWRHEGNRVALSLRPFELVTLHLRR